MKLEHFDDAVRVTAQSGLCLTGLNRQYRLIFLPCGTIPFSQQSSEVGVNTNHNFIGQLPISPGTGVATLGLLIRQYRDLKGGSLEDILKRDKEGLKAKKDKRKNKKKNPLDKVSNISTECKSCKLKIRSSFGNVSSVSFKSAYLELPHMRPFSSR